MKRTEGNTWKYKTRNTQEKDRKGKKKKGKLEKEKTVKQAVRKNHNKTHKRTHVEKYNKRNKSVIRLLCKKHENIQCIDPQSVPGCNLKSVIS